jgi:hypothetical protein
MYIYCRTDREFILFLACHVHWSRFVTSNNVVAHNFVANINLPLSYRKCVHGNDSVTLSSSYGGGWTSLEDFVQPKCRKFGFQMKRFLCSHPHLPISHHVNMLFKESDCNGSIRRLSHQFPVETQPKQWSLRMKNLVLNCQYGHW